MFIFVFFLFFWKGHSFFSVTPGQQRLQLTLLGGRSAFFSAGFFQVRLDEVKLIGNRRLRDMQFVLVTVYRFICFCRERLTNCNNKIICRSSRRWLSHSVGGAVYELLLRWAGVSRILCRHGDKVPGWVILKLSLSLKIEKILISVLKEHLQNILKLFLIFKKDFLIELEIFDCLKYVL